MRNQKYNILCKSSAIDLMKVKLGTIEKDAPGFNGDMLELNW